MWVNVTLKVGGMPQAQITADENVLKHIVADVNNGTLVLNVQKGFWLNSSRPEMMITVPFLTSITTKGQQTNVGNVLIEGIDVKSFTVNQLYGKIMLKGQVETLIIKSSNTGYYRHSGMLDASELGTKTVIAHIEGSNMARLNCNTLEAKLNNDAVIKLTQKPSKITLLGKAQLVNDKTIAAAGVYEIPTINKPAIKEQPLTYLEFKIQNNSPLRRNFVVSGPNGRGGSFSYGFPLNPYQIKSEKFPAGTKFYAAKGAVRGKLLAHITEQDEGALIMLND